MCGRILLASRRFVSATASVERSRSSSTTRAAFRKESASTFPRWQALSTPDDISQQEALALWTSRRVGLVHTVSNVMKGIGYVCNCCSCCCAIMRGITEWGIENSVARANYYAVIDSDECLGCGTCIERCHVHAISDQDGVSVVDRDKCIGCGLCVTGCPNEVARLERRPRPNRHGDGFSDVGHERLANRG
jgi:ferredoxin